MLVHKDCDWRAVEQFISQEQSYGRAKVEEAKSIIARKSPDNPKRTVGYFIGTVKNLLTKAIDVFLAAPK
jgi:hypothetical protein